MKKTPYLNMIDSAALAGASVVLVFSALFGCDSGEKLQDERDARQREIAEQVLGAREEQEKERVAFAAKHRESVQGVLDGFFGWVESHADTPQEIEGQTECYSGSDPQAGYCSTRSDELHIAQWKKANPTAFQFTAKGFDKSLRISCADIEAKRSENGNNEMWVSSSTANSMMRRRNSPVFMFGSRTHPTEPT